MKKYILLAIFIAAVSPAVFASGLEPEGGSSARSAAPAEAQVDIFVTSWCPYCRHLEDFLKKHQISYTRYDVENDAKGAQIFEAIGGTGVPVARVGKSVIHGYDPDRILAALQARS